MSQPPFQPELQRHIERLKPSDLPAPPQSALAILRASSDEHIDLTKLADIASRDPGLVAELLRLVNSPLYGLGREVTSARHGIGLLGVRALRNMVLCLSVRDAIANYENTALDLTAYWEAALRRGVSAKALYEACGADGDEGFTAGLLQDFGFLALYVVTPPEATTSPSIQALDPEQRLHQEREIFGVCHDEVFEVLSEAWSLPAALSEPLRHHHDFEAHPAERAWQAKSRALYCADWVSNVFSSSTPAAAMQRAGAVMQRYCDMDAAACEAHLQDIPRQVLAAGEALGLHVQEQDDLDEVMRRANRRLAAANLSYQELTWKLEKAIAERDRLASELNKEISLAQEIQRSLLPGPMPENFPLYGVNLPARNLSGDFFDYFPLPDRRIGFCIGDVAGKGINAALLMAKTCSLFHCLGKHVHDPAKLVSIINDELAESSTRGYFVTLLAGIFDPASAEIELVNAGHLPAILVDRAGKVEYLEATAPPVGISKATEYVTQPGINLQDCHLYIASDGVTEARHEQGRELGLAGLAAMLASYQELSAPQRVLRVMQTLTANNRNTEDDMTLLVVSGTRHDG